MLFSIRARPGAGASCVKGVWEGVLRVDVAAPPEKGKANAELAKFLAKLLGVSRSCVTIHSGEHSRDKVIAVAGVEAGEIEAAINTIMGENA